jgi:hypothetical protein
MGEADVAVVQHAGFAGWLALLGRPLTRQAYTDFAGYKAGLRGRDSPRKVSTPFPASGVDQDQLNLTGNTPIPDTNALLVAGCRSDRLYTSGISRSRDDDRAPGTGHLWVNRIS